MEKLNDMVGRKWKYKGVTFTILKAKYHNGEVTITTDLEGDKDRFSINANEIKQFEEVHEKRDAIVLSVLPQNGVLESLQKTVMDNIAKVQKNKDYIPQAQSINDSIKTLCDLAKLELQAYAISRPRKSRA